MTEQRRKHILNSYCHCCCRSEATPAAIMYNKLLLITIMAYAFIFCNASQPEVEDETPFTYTEGTGKGPKEWGLINPEWRACGNGKMQSPIDLLHTELQISPKLGKLKRAYRPALATVKNRGHDITLEWKAYAGKISINGTKYHLQRCHWHTTSEHSFNGTRYEMELHLVHQSSDEKIAVIGIAYRYGRPDTFLTRLFHHIKSAGKEEQEVGIVNPGDIKFGSRKYYRYMGSLTIPPCSEGVIWTIDHKVRTVSREQVRTMRDVVHDGFKTDARPTQQLNGRKVWLCTPRHNGGF